MEPMEQDDHFIPDGMNDFERSVKRIGDCLLAFIGLIVFSPLFLICYLAVKHEDGGPAIFRQERVGRFGRPFYIYKFRSMKLDAEKYGPALYAGGRDERLTKIGRFLREHHWTSFLNFGMFFVVIWLLSVLVRKENFILIRLWNMTPAIVIYFRFVRELLRMLLCIMGIRIQWRKCYAGCGMIYFIWSVVHGSSISKYCL